MAGNEAEYCNDILTCNQGKQAAVDPVRPPTGTERVLRGGGWIYGNDYDSTLLSDARVPWAFSPTTSPSVGAQE